MYYEINCCNCNDQVGPKCGFFQWVDNEICRSETAPLVRERISLLKNELQLANQREMRSSEMEERSNQREREAHELYVEAREELKTNQFGRMASGATCVQKLDDSRDSAIHTKYRISLRSSSMREPRYPLPRVVLNNS